MNHCTKFLFILSLVLVMASCSKDDPENNSIEGTWTAESVSGTVVSTVDFGGTTTTTNAEFIGSNLAYDATFDGTVFSTEGSYDFELTLSVTGIPPSTQMQNYTNVSGSGTYTTDGNMITTMGSFFDLEFNGMPAFAANAEQTATYEINSDGKLVFTQDETTTDNTSGVASTTTTVSTSTWIRK